jgi:hypothetical protein
MTDLVDALNFRSELEETLHKIILLRPSCIDRSLLIKSILQMPDFDCETARKNFGILIGYGQTGEAEDLASSYNKYSIDAGLGRHLPD